MKKILLYSLGIVVALLLIAGIVAVRFMNNFLYKEKPDYLTFSIDSTLIDFEWAEQDYGNFTEPHAAIIFPVKLDGFSQKFYFQFDTGAPTTTIYSKPLESLQTHKPDFEVIEKGEKRYLQNLSCQFGENQFNANMIEVYENFGKPFELNDTTDYISLGTIGSDFLKEKISVIDFKNRFLQVFDERPDWMSDLPKFKPCDFKKGRRIIFPAEIAGKKLKLFWDSGSSAFGLMTSKSRYKKFSDKKTEEQKFDANSWGSSIPIHHKSTDAPLIIGGADLTLKKVSYVDMYSWVQGFLAPLSKIGGLLGNKPFTESVLIIDTKKEEFLVLTGDKRIGSLP